MLNSYYFHCLNDEDRNAYSSLLDSIRNNKSTALLKSIPSNNAITSVKYDHPELCSYSANCLQYICSNVGVAVKNFQSADNSTIEKVYKTAKQIATSLSGTEDQIVRTAHNYLVKNVKYDYKRAISNVYEHTTHSVIGPFLYGNGVCEGIALAFKMLLDMKGIDNAVVVGALKNRQSPSGEPNHMWNVVSINGNNYFIDVTQDIATTDSKWNKPSYMFYMLTDDELRRTHIWNDNFNCCSIKDNPFDRYNRNFTTVRQIKAYVSSLPKQEKLIYFKCTNLAENEISQSVMQALANPFNPKVSLSMFQNAGRYYFYKER